MQSSFMALEWGLQGESGGGEVGPKLLWFLAEWGGSWWEGGVSKWPMNTGGIHFSESVVQTQGRGKSRATGGLSPLLTISSSSQGLDFLPDVFLSNRLQWKEGHWGPQYPEHHKTGRVSPKENAHIHHRGRSGEEYGQGNDSWKQVHLA